jgi:hypothetical protein
MARIDGGIALQQGVYYKQIPTLLADRRYRFEKILLVLSETVLVVVLANHIGLSTITGLDLTGALS